MPSPNHIVFFDTTLRDGEQSPGCTMHHEEKLRLAHQIAALGVDVLEAGFAIASDGDLAAIQAVAREVRGPRIASLARCKREDIEAAARAIEAAPSNRIHLVLASSDLHLEYKLRITRDQALDHAAESVRLARSFTEDVEFSTEDGTRSDPEFLLKMITVAVQAGATTINIPDNGRRGLCRRFPGRGLPEARAWVIKHIHAAVQKDQADRDPLNRSTTWKAEGPGMMPRPFDVRGPSTCATGPNGIPGQPSSRPSRGTPCQLRRGAPHRRR
jgi:isopropylmalate/homocitrate/citramalate synthase